MSLRGCTFVCSAAVLLGLQGPCPAQPDLAAGDVRAALLATGQERWSDAVTLFQRIIDNRGGELTPVPVPAEGISTLVGGPAVTVLWGNSRSIQARWICHQQISRIPALLEAHRRRYGNTAAKRWKDLGDNPSDADVQSFLADCFNSKRGETAILLLANRHFDRAEFGAAIHYWKLLLPGAADELHYPDPATSPATMEASILLARLFRGEREQVASLLPKFRQRHPDARGLLAGREGSYADTLAAVIRDPRQTAIAQVPADGREWGTFAACPSRNAVVSVGLPFSWRAEPTWRVPLSNQPRRAEGLNARRPAKPPGGAFPIIARRRVFVAGTRQIFGIDLQDGEVSAIYPGTDLEIEDALEDAANPLTFADGVLYGRLTLGSPLHNNPDEPQRENSIVALAVPENPKEPAAHLWTLRSSRGPTEAGRIFAGPPMAVGRHLLVSVRLQQGGQTVRAIACYRLGPERRPEKVWERPVGRADARGAEAVPDEVLTHAGHAVIYSSNTGFVTAVEIESGQPLWEFRYGSIERNGRATSTPGAARLEAGSCLFDGESVFAAPNDAPGLFCLDARTGRLKWQRDDLKLDHLLGAVAGRIVVSVEGPLRGVRGLDVETGSDAGPFGWMQHGEGAVSAGKGFVTTDAVCWPTRHALYFLDLIDGSPSRAPLAGEFGNLAAANGWLVSATWSEMKSLSTQDAIPRLVPVKGNSPSPLILR